jgi:hypothetical protein
MAEEQNKPEKEIIQDLITKSEEEFEKKITYIGAGALLLSLTLVEKVIKFENSQLTGFLIAGWSTLVLSLLINLLSHLISKLYLRKIQYEIFNKVDIGIRIKKHKRRVCIIDSFNWSSAISLILGIVFIVVFASVNAQKHSPNKEIQKSKQDTISRILIK